MTDPGEMPLWEQASQTSGTFGPFSGTFGPFTVEDGWTLPRPIGRADLPPTPDLHIIILGLPGPQGSKTSMPIYEGSGSERRWTGRTRVFESSGKVKPWREAVEAGIEAWRDDWEATNDELWRPLDCAIEAEMVFTLPRPEKSKFDALKYRGAPCGPPDLSKLVRATEDAITKARGWQDDARVVGYRKLVKVWVDDPFEVDALDQSGAVIRLYRKAPHG